MQQIDTIMYHININVNIYINFYHYNFENMLKYTTFVVRITKIKNTMNFKYKNILVLMLLIGSSLSLTAQNLPYRHFKVLKGDTLHFQARSYGYGPLEIVTPQNGEIPNPGVGTGEDGTVYNMEYWPDTSFIGKDHAVLEYLGDPGSDVFSWHKKIIEIDFEVLISIIQAKKDFYTIAKNSTGDTLDILVNDSTTADSLFLNNVINIKNGSVSITPDNKVIFTPESGFEGKTYFNYEISDELGSKMIGHVVLDVTNDFGSPDTLNYYVTNTNKLSIIPNEVGFSASTYNQPQLGDLDNSNDPEIIYTPDVEALGVDNFYLVKNNDSIFVNITVVDGREDGNVIVDDNVFTGKNTSVSFNVKDNDFKKNYFNLSYTQPSNGELQYQGQGNFTYTPNDGFSGIDEFVYTAMLSFNLYQSATVKIFVNNFTPESYAPYDMNVSKNTSFVLNYKVPIEGSSFNLITLPLNGSVDIYPGLDTVYVNCGDIVGNDLIVYTPNNEFTGDDRFEVEYCPPNDECRLIKVNMHVLDELSDTTCPCASTNCVWPGDSDNNGVVDITDILPIGIYIGESGDSRNITTTNWLGLNSNDWNISQTENGINMKYADTDGNGIITENDSIDILNYYNKSHNLYNELVLNQPDYPIYIYTNQDTLHIGDTLHLIIEAGDIDFPARDINGISYTIVVDPSKVDSSSLHHEFIANSWLTNASASIQLNKQVQDGQVDAAFSRIGYDGVSGIGEIAICDYIVEDDLDGAKLSSYFNGVKSFTVKLNNVVGMNGKGENIGFPDSEVTLYLKVDGNKPSNNLALNVYPNPASDKVSISISGDEKISSLRVYNSLGSINFSKSLMSVNSEQLDISTYTNGIYLIEIVTDKNNRIVKKIEVMK